MDRGRWQKKSNDVAGDSTCSIAINLLAFLIRSGDAKKRWQSLPSNLNIETSGVSVLVLQDACTQLF